MYAGRKRDDPGASQRRPFLDPTQPSTSAAGAAAAAAAAPKPPGPAAGATPAAAVARRLAGMRCVTISLPGVLLEESSPAELEESASVRPGAAGKCPPAASAPAPGLAPPALRSRRLVSPPTGQPSTRPPGPMPLGVATHCLRPWPAWALQRSLCWLSGGPTAAAALPSTCLAQSC